MPFQKLAFAVILLGYFVAGTLFATLTPAWQAPDEPAHFNYIRQVAEDGCCPIVAAGDWDSEYLSQLTSAKFAPDLLDELHTIQYEDHHPPLYYILASIIYKLSAGDLTALRLFSVALGAVSVCLSFAICMRLAPDSPQIALAVMALIAFLPQRLAMMSAVNNDALAEALVAFSLWLLLRYIEGDRVPLWQLGLAAGLALLCKITIYFTLPLLALGITLKLKDDNCPLRDILRPVAAFALIAVVMGSIWWLRNLSVYGFPDFLALAAHDAVVADQPRTADYIASQGFAAYLSGLFSVTFKSFWGQFGWMALPLDGIFSGLLYPAFALLTLAGVGGTVARVKFTKLRPILIVLLAQLIIVAVAYIYYNLEFLQWQGRYLIPALIPIALTLCAGLDHWREKLLPRHRWLVPLGIFSLLPLDFYLLFRVIAPGLTP